MGREAWDALSALDKDNVSVSLHIRKANARRTAKAARAMGCHAAAARWDEIAFSFDAALDVLRPAAIMIPDSSHVCGDCSAIRAAPGGVSRKWCFIGHGAIHDDTAACGDFLDK